MLKKISFIIVIIGIALLLSLLILSPKEVNVEDIENLTLNKKVFFRGKVEHERDFGNFKIWQINEIEVVCDCNESYLNKEVEITGLVSEFEGKTQVRVLRLVEMLNEK